MNTKISVKEGKSFNRLNATGSVILAVSSVFGYFLVGFIESNYGLEPGEFKIAMLLVAAVSALATVSAVITIAIAHRWYKLFFASLAIVTVLVCGVCLFGASFI